MASTYLYEYEVIPEDIRLREVVDDTPSIVNLVPIFVYVPEEVKMTVVPEEVKLYLFDAVPENVILREDVLDLNFARSVDILLRQLGIAVEEEEEPPVTYFGVLKRWTGYSWLKAKLKTFIGAFVEKPVKFYDGSEWKLVDTTG